MTALNDASSLSVVHIGPHVGGTIAARPLDYLDRAEFARYIAACRGCEAVLDPVTKAQVAAVARAADLVSALKAAGFAIQIDPKIAEMLHAAIAALHAEAQPTITAVADLVADLESRGRSLRRYQAEAVAWMWSRHAGLIADDPGLGKTVIGCVAIQKRAPVVIICPVNAKGVWVKHLTAWRRDIYPTVLEGRKSFRWPLPGEAVILNYAILPETWGEKKGDPFPTGKKGQLKLERQPRPGTVIIADEAHNVKSNKALCSKRFRAMVRAALAADGYAFPMTGTPMLNGAAELWNLLSHIDCAEEAFDDWPTFVRLMGGRKVGGSLVWPTDKDGLPIVSPEAADRLRRVMLRRQQCDVLKELPERQHIDLPYVLDETTRKMVDDIMRELQAAGIDIEHALDIAKNTTGFESMSKVRKALAISAIPAMLEIVNEIEATGEPQIVASAHRAPIDLLGKRPGWATITGDVDANTRTAIESKFQRGELKGIAMTISAGGVALTLTRAYQMLFVDLMWTPALNKQAEDRICRYGQTKSCLIRRLVGDHELVERVAEKLLEKQRRIAASVDAASVGEGHVAIGGEAAARLQGVLAQVTAIGIAPDGHVRTAPLVENRPL